MIWLSLHPQFHPEMLGMIPGFLDEDDPRPARAQIAANYAHGGGWSPMPKFTLHSVGELRYPGDPPLYPLAVTTLRDELIFYYELSWLAVVQPDGSFEVSRLD